MEVFRRCDKISVQASFLSPPSAFAYRSSFHVGTDCLLFCGSELIGWQPCRGCRRRSAGRGERGRLPHGSRARFNRLLRTFRSLAGPGNCPAGVFDRRPRRVRPLDARPRPPRGNRHAFDARLPSFELFSKVTSAKKDFDIQYVLSRRTATGFEKLLDWTVQTDVDSPKMIPQLVEAAEGFCAAALRTCSPRRDSPKRCGRPAISPAFRGTSSTSFGSGTRLPSLAPCAHSRRNPCEGGVARIIGRPRHRLRKFGNAQRVLLQSGP